MKSILSLMVATIFFAGCQSGAVTEPQPSTDSPSTTSQAPARLETVVLQVDGMTCASCGVEIQRVMKENKAISGCDVDQEKGEASIRYDANKLAPAEVVQILEKGTHFKASIKQPAEAGKA